MNIDLIKCVGTVSVAIFFALSTGCADPAAEPDSNATMATGSLDVSESDFRETLAELTTEIDDLPAVSTRVTAAVKKFYEARDNRPVWLTEEGRPGDRLDELESAMLAAERHGLQRSDYGFDRLDSRIELLNRTDKANLAAQAEEAARLDVLATSALAALLTDMADGRYQPGDLAARVEPIVEVELERLELQPALEQALAADDLAAELESHAPDHPQYEALVALLADLRAEDQSDLPELTTTQLLAKGQADPDVVIVRKLLNQRCQGCETLPVEGEQAEMYDDAVSAAVKTFQEENGLAVDGLLGTRTGQLLNLRAGHKIRMVQVNLDRWRWYEMDDERFIHVNVPEFMLRYHEDGARHYPRLKMRVIVGSPSHPTPLFNETLEYLVLRPYWNVPYSITTEEMLPKIEDNPFYLYDKNIEIVDSDEGLVSPYAVTFQDIRNGDYRLRQQPGPDNALGMIKFMMPNKHAIYLHDTNAPQLFERNDRALSHGCIRLDDPFALATLLKPSEARWWSRSALMRGGEPSEEVSLDQKVPVYVTYFTVVVEEGQPKYLPDAYGIDSATKRLLAEAGRTSEADARVAGVPEEESETT